MTNTPCGLNLSETLLPRWHMPTFLIAYFQADPGREQHHFGGRFLQGGWAHGPPPQVQSLKHRHQRFPNGIRIRLVSTTLRSIFSLSFLTSKWFFLRVCASSAYSLIGLTAIFFPLIFSFFSARTVSEKSVTKRDVND